LCAKRLSTFSGCFLQSERVLAVATHK